MEIPKILIIKFSYVFISIDHETNESELCKHPPLLTKFTPGKKTPLFRYRIDIVCRCRLRIALRIVFRNKKSCRFGVAFPPSQ